MFSLHEKAVCKNWSLSHNAKILHGSKPPAIHEYNTALKALFGNLKVSNINIVGIVHTVVRFKKKINGTSSWYGLLVYNISPRETKNVLGPMHKTEAQISSFVCHLCDHPY